MRPSPPPVVSDSGNSDSEREWLEIEENMRRKEESEAQYQLEVQQAASTLGLSVI